MASSLGVIPIRNSLDAVIQHVVSTPKVKASQINNAESILATVLSETANKPIERFYFLYHLCNSCTQLNKAQVDKLLKILVPASASTNKSELIISQILNLSLCHTSIYATILDATSTYLDASHNLEIDVASWAQTETLAQDSPNFCSAFISRPDLSKFLIDKRLLGKWIQDLSKTEKSFSYPNLDQVIKYSLFDTGYSKLLTITRGRQEFSDSDFALADSDLHLSILTLMQCKRCQPLTNQFIVDICTNLSGLHKAPENQRELDTIVLADRLAQILSVAISSNLLVLTSALKTSLKALSFNKLIMSVVHMKTGQ